MKAYRLVAQIAKGRHYADEDVCIKSCRLKVGKHRHVRARRHKSVYNGIERARAKNIIRNALKKQGGIIMGKLYIAYGSNLNLRQMAARCPSATVYAAGRLNNWELVFRGSPGNSHATIRRKKGSSVPVLVWSISPSDEYQLDIYEGYPKYYYKQNIMVDIAGKKRKAMVYIMDRSRCPGAPSQYYINTIRQGYMDNDLDMSYFDSSLELNSIECNGKM